MYEKIKAIREVTSEKKPGESYGSYDGFAIETENQTIKLLIDNGQSCCENWGYFMSEDDVEEFVGAYLKEVTITDTALKTEKLPEYGLDCGDCMFVNLETDSGTLQFVAYNCHNGYYGHSACVISRDLNHETCL